jgi:hypothetical protein
MCRVQVVVCMIFKLEKAETIKTVTGIPGMVFRHPFNLPRQYFFSCQAIVLQVINGMQ